MPPALLDGALRHPLALHARHALCALAAPATLAALLLCASVAWAATSPTAAAPAAGPSAGTRAAQPATPATPPSASTATERHSDALPPAVASALRAAALPPEALALWLAPVQPQAAPLLAQRATEPVNPASLLKLVTSFAALDLLGPGHVWRTEVLSSGAVQAGVLHGNLYLRGGADPALVSERLWLLLRRVQALGIERIGGDIVLDRSALGEPEIDPGAFNDDPLRAYNAGPDALLINFRAQVFTFTPDAAAGVARVSLEPPLAGVQFAPTVPLSAQPCADWRAGLRADFRVALEPRWSGSYPADCGVRHWPLAHPEPRRMSERAVLGMWQSLGGRIDGRVREGSVSAGAVPRLVFESPPLAEVVRDANKFSNNVMAQHLLLALSPADRKSTRLNSSHH